MHLEPTRQDQHGDRVAAAQARRSAMAKVLAASEELDAAQAVPPAPLGENLTRDIDAVLEMCNEIETRARRARELVAQAAALADFGGVSEAPPARLYVV